MPHLLRLLLPLALVFSSGCATVHGPADPRDPLERYNRAVYAFNDDFDRKLFQPLARGYNKVVPGPVNRGISNFFSNLDDVWVMTNNFLQGKPGLALSDLSRIAWNTTIGLGGIFDVASHLELPKHNEDFGQTLGVWGVGPGPYFVLPFLGPSTIRDSAGLGVQWIYDPLGELTDEETRLYLTALYVVDTRAGLLRATQLLDSASLDSYAFMRDAFLQRREYLVHDGNPPQQAFDPFDEDFDPFAEDPLDADFDPFAEDPTPPPDSP